MLRRVNLIWFVIAGVPCALPTGCSKPPPRAVPGKPVVSVAQPVRRMVTEAMEYTGYTSADKSVQLRAQVQGYLQETLFKPRDRVKAGTPLFQIDPRPFQAELDKAEADLAVARAQYDLSVAKLARMENSLKANAISEIQVIEQRAEKDKAKAEIDQCEAVVQKAKLNLQYATIVAPFDGVMDRDIPGKGDLIQPQQTVMTRITDDSVVYVYFNMSENDVLQLRTAARKKAPATPPEKIPPIPVFVGLANEDGYPHEGVIDYAATEVDRSTGTIEVRGRFENPTRALIAGLFVRVRLPVSEPTPALMVAERAIGIDQGQRYVLVLGEGNKTQYRPIRAGLLEGGLRVIEAGIAENDSVVVIGLQRARPGTEVEPQHVTMESVIAPAGRPAATKPAGASAASSRTGH